MKKEDFIAIFKETLHIKGEITEETILSNIPEWDSLGVIVTVALLNREFNVNITSSEIQKCSTVKDIIYKVWV